MFISLEDLYIGEEVLVLFKNVDDPEWWNTEYIPVRIDQEFEKFFVCTVLPHVNNKGAAVSREYRMTLNKTGLGEEFLLKLAL